MPEELVFEGGSYEAEVHEAIVSAMSVLDAEEARKIVEAAPIVDGVATHTVSLIINGYEVPLTPAIMRLYSTFDGRVREAARDMISQKYNKIHEMLLDTADKVDTLRRRTLVDMGANPDNL